MEKVIAVLDKPENCKECVFCVCKYSLPLSLNRKGYYCKLLSRGKRAVQDFEYDADVHLDNCPLRKMPEKKQNACTHGFAGGWNACIDAIIGN